MQCVSIVPVSSYRFAVAIFDVGATFHKIDTAPHRLSKGAAIEAAKDYAVNRGLPYLNCFVVREGYVPRAKDVEFMSHWTEGRL